MPFSWVSGNSAVITVPPPPPPDSATHITGTVTRPNDADTQVTLTATLTKNMASDTIRFTLTVIISEDGMDVEMAKDSLMIGYAAGNSRTSVTQDVTLPTAGANGVSISWESSDCCEYQHHRNGNPAKCCGYRSHPDRHPHEEHGP